MDHVTMADYGEWRTSRTNACTFSDFMRNVQRTDHLNQNGNASENERARNAASLTCASNTFDNCLHFLRQNRIEIWMWNENSIKQR